MNQVVARSVIRRLINSQKSPISTFRSHDDIAIANRQRLGIIGGGARVFGTRMMSAAGENEAAKENKVSVTSYWGVARPKVKREDGSDWPWNCFMVRNNLLSILA